MAVRLAREEAFDWHFLRSGGSAAIALAVELI